jgi:hypothetical protein
LATVGNIEMPIDIHNIYWWLIIIYFFISALFLAHNFIMLLLNRKSKFRKIMMSFFIINMLLSTILFLFLGNSTELVGSRKKAIDNLTKLSNLQFNYKINNGRYASKFEEIGFIPIDIRFTYIMIDDFIKPLARPAELPSYIKVEKNHIYSVICINMDKNFRNCDTLSVDFEGNVEILESFNYWPLPEPKWHDWK